MPQQSEPLHERYPLQRVRVVRDGKASTVCVEWDDWLEWLVLTPGKDPARLCALVRECVREIEAGGKVRGLSAKVRAAVRARLEAF